MRLTYLLAGGGVVMADNGYRSGKGDSAADYGIRGKRPGDFIATSALTPVRNYLLNDGTPATAPRYGCKSLFGLPCDDLVVGTPPAPISPEGYVFVDAWNRPLIYIHISSQNAEAAFDLTATNPPNTLVTDVRGRARLSQMGPSDVIPSGRWGRPSVPALEPQPNGGRETDFEIWSAGPDGLYDDVRLYRDAHHGGDPLDRNAMKPVDRDNIEGTLR